MSKQLKTTYLSLSIKPVKLLGINVGLYTQPGAYCSKSIDFLFGKQMIFINILFYKL